jgi:hypothetical protein
MADVNMEQAESTNIEAQQVSTQGGIPERELTLQYKPLKAVGAGSGGGIDEPNRNTPNVAGGEQIKIYAESVKEIFQKEPQFQSIQKGEDSHIEGDETLVIDTMKAKHKFEITGWVYAGKQGKHSLPPYEGSAAGGLRNGDGTASVTGDIIKAEEFNRFIHLGDPGIVYDSETIRGNTAGVLDRGTDYEIDYDTGQIKFLEGNIATTQKETKILGQTLSTRTVIDEDFEVSYDFEVSAQNIASQVRKMSQLGNPFVMRIDSKEITADTGTSSRGFLITPKKVQIVSKASKPDEYKLELEVRKGVVETSV